MADDGAARLPTWRRLSAAGGGLLALTFVLPAVQSCNSDVIPAEELARVTRAVSVSDRAGMAAIYLVPYLLGLLVLVAAAVRAQGVRRALGVAVIGLLVHDIVTVAGGFVSAVAAGELDGADLALAVPVALSAAYVIRSARRGEAGLLGVRWFAAMLCVLWFGAWVVSGSARYGVVLSFLGSVGIAAGAAGELRALTGLGWSALLRRLATASVELPRARGP
jgi:hypothetical protein